MRLSIVIITWNEKEDLQKCLDSFVTTLDFTIDEVIVIDNGSSDGTLELIEDSYPLVRYYYLDRNIGVGPARNKGICLSRGKYVMTLDNDTQILSGELGERIDSVFSHYNDVGLLGFSLLNPDGTYQRSIRRFPKIIQPLAARIPVLRKFKLFSHEYDRHMMVEVDLSKINRIIDVDYVIGANQVYKKDLAVMLGCYDEKIFYGPEDCEFCYRIHKTGHRVVYDPSIKITHAYDRKGTKNIKLALRQIFGFLYIFVKYRKFWSLD